MQPELENDYVEARLDGQNGLILTSKGIDRPNIVAHVAKQIEENGGYIQAISFGLTGPDRYFLEIESRGYSKNSLRDLHLLVESGLMFSKQSALSGKFKHFDWAKAYMFHLYLHTPDQRGLVAKLSQIIAKVRDVPDDWICPFGTVLFLVGKTVNTDGPEGGTAYFTLRAIVATQTIEIRNEILAHFENVRKKREFTGVWTTILDPNIESDSKG